MTPDRYDWEPFSSHLPKQASAGMPTTVTVWSLFFTTTILVSNAWAITCFSAMVKSGEKWWNKPCKLGYDKSSQLHYTSWQRIVPLRCQRGWKIPHGPSIGVGERSSEGTLKILGRKKHRWDVSREHRNQTPLDFWPSIQILFPNYTVLFPMIHWKTTGFVFPSMLVYAGLWRFIKFITPCFFQISQLVIVIVKP